MRTVVQTRTEREGGREFHEVADLFPLMHGEEFDQLKADIAANGLRKPIVLHPDGRIIDGRNRYRACVDVGVTPLYSTWDGRGSLVSYVVSLNLHRRHLTSSQQAVIAIEANELVEKLRAEARDRQLAGVKQDLDQRFDQGSSGRGPQVDEQLAAIFDTNRQYVSDAKKLKREAPDLLHEVKVGDKTIPQAKRELNKRNKAEPPPLPTDDKYRVIYADPPWKYGNSGIIGEADNYGHVERHYPSMSIGELCDLGDDIRIMSAGDAVLFMWATSPMLEDAFSVIKAWGFKYKTSFVWDKVRHNFGHYNSVRHEMLLVCIRGSCTPDIPKLYDSVQSIEKSGRHSEKPQEFRSIIDDLYQWGKRIELFGREPVQGWEVWGNEPAVAV